MSRRQSRSYLTDGSKDGPSHILPFDLDYTHDTFGCKRLISRRAKRPALSSAALALRPVEEKSIYSTTGAGVPCAIALRLSRKHTRNSSRSSGLLAFSVSHLVRFRNGQDARQSGAACRCDSPPYRIANDPPPLHFPQQRARHMLLGFASTLPFSRPNAVHERVKQPSKRAFAGFLPPRR